MALHPLLSDIKLARRLEADEMLGLEECMQAAQQRQPHVGAERLAVADGIALFCGEGSPLSRAVGLGMRRPIEPGHLRQLREFYASHGSPAEFDLCPLADESLWDAAGREGYHIKEFENVWVRSLGDPIQLERDAREVRVLEISLDQAGLWADVVDRGFNEGRTPALMTERIGLILPYAANTRCFLAYVGETPAGGAALSVHGPTAALFSAATLPEFRRSGVQTALLAARLAAAAASGCDVAQVHTTPGSASQRNVERIGFRLAYTKCAMRRPQPAREVDHAA
jgi:GNAT superfamily N-acetyltransferase